MFLPSVLALPGDGTSTGGCSQHCGVEHDPRSRRLRSGAQPRGMGKLARHCRIASCYGNRWRWSSSANRRILRVLMAQKSEPLAVERIVDLLRHRIHIQGAVEKLLNGFRDTQRLTQDVAVFHTMDRYVGLVFQPGVDLIQMGSQSGNQCRRSQPGTGCPSTPDHLRLRSDYFQEGTLHKDVAKSLSPLCLRPPRCNPAA